MSDGINLDSAINGILNNTFGEGHGDFYSGYDSLEYQKQQEAKAAAEAVGTPAPAPSTSDSGFDDYMNATPAPTPAPAPSTSDSGFDDYMKAKPAPAPEPTPEPVVEKKKESSYDIDELIGSITSVPESAKKTSYDDDYEPFAETRTLAIGKSARKEPKKDYDSSRSKYETRSRYEDDDEDYAPRRPVKKARRVEYDYDDDDYDDEDDYEYSRPSRRRRGSSRILSRRRRSRYDDDMILDLAEIEYQLRRLNEKHDDVKAIIPQLEQTQLLNRHNFSRGDSISRDQALEMIKKEAIEVAKAEFRKEQELAELRKLASMRDSTPPPAPRAPEPAPPPPLPPAPEPTPFPSITGMNNSASGSYSYKSAFAPGTSGVPVLKPIGGGTSGPSSFGSNPSMGGMNRNMGGMGNNMQRPGGMPPNGFNPNRR